MINDLRIHLSVIMYMLGCFSIMAYNSLVIYRKRSRSKFIKKNTTRWIDAIYQQLATNNATICPKHKKHLSKNLTHVEKLIAFSYALNFFNQGYGKDLYKKYMSILAESRIFQPLVQSYKKKRSQERAYFAHFVSQHPSVAKDAEGLCKNTTDTMVMFAVKSDIYCRVNVLKALSRLGDMQGIASVLQYFSQKPAFIHHKLLAEDLYNFAGDKEALALKLWEGHELWNDNIMLGVITFIAMFSGGFQADFLPVLQRQSTSEDIRLALIRYYKQYSYEPALPVLIDYLNQTDNYELAMEAATSLSAYPGPTTTHVLNTALESENWHVRYNAVSSLVELGAYLGSDSDSAQSRDSDVLQIIEYKLDHAVENFVNASEIAT